MKSDFRFRRVSSITAGLALAGTMLWTSAFAGADEGAFKLHLPNGAVLQGKNRWIIPASALPPGSVIKARGKYTEFDVNTDSFTAMNYTMTGAPAQKEITGLRRTVIFKSKSPQHPWILNGALQVDINDEQLVIRRASASIAMKISAKDRSQGDLFDMESSRTITYFHELAPGFTYFRDNLGRVLFTNGIFKGRENPRTARMIAPSGDVTGTTQTAWEVSPGGRVGMIVGEDATQP
jgi:hypothetical protein